MSWDVITLDSLEWNFEQLEHASTIFLDRRDATLAETKALRDYCRLLVNLYAAAGGQRHRLAMANLLDRLTEREVQLSREAHLEQPTVPPAARKTLVTRDPALLKTLHQWKTRTLASFAALPHRPQQQKRAHAVSLARPQAKKTLITTDPRLQSAFLRLRRHS